MSKDSLVSDCKLIELPKMHNRSGNLTSVNGGKEIPFHITRVYYLYDIPGGESRGAHAHYDLEQIIIATSGCFDVVLDDGIKKRTITMNRPYQGLYIKPGIWRDLINFSSGSVLLVLASLRYTEEDYIRNYDSFLKYKNGDN